MPQHLRTFTVNVRITLNDGDKHVPAWRWKIGGYFLRIANFILGTKIEVK